MQSKLNTKLNLSSSAINTQPSKLKLTWGVRIAFLAVVVGSCLYANERWQQWQANDEISPVDYRTLVKLQYQYARNKNFNTLLQQAFADDKVTRLEFDYINQIAAKVILKENIDMALTGDTNDLVVLADNHFASSNTMNQALEFNDSAYNGVGDIKHWLDRAREGL